MRKVIFSKLKVSLAIIAIGSIVPMSYLFANTICVVSSNPENNTGFCVELAGGGDGCVSTGQGPACSGSATVIQPVLGL